MICPLDMEALFYGDPDHDSNDLIWEFRNELKMRHAEGYRTLFLEFLYENPPTTKQDIIEQYVTCSGGRRFTADAYAAMVLYAQQLFTVYGLERPEYYGLSRSAKSRVYYAFRFLGGYDAVAAEIIRQNASANNNYIVRLGAGHWPLMKHRLPMLRCAAHRDETVVDPDKDFKDVNMRLVSEYTGRLLDEYVGRGVTVESSKVLVSNFGKRISINVDLATSFDTFAALWQDKEGFPPDPERVAAIVRTYRNGGKKTATVSDNNNDNNNNASTPTNLTIKLSKTSS